MPDTDDDRWWRLGEGLAGVTAGLIAVAVAPTEVWR
jgi:hypothetical protein